MSPHRIRPATPDDVPETFAIVRELAEYEKSAHEVQSNEGLLHSALFADDPAVWCSILERQDSPEETWRVAGFAIWFRKFFTWTAKHFRGVSWSTLSAQLLKPPQDRLSRRSPPAPIAPAVARSSG